MSLVLPGLLVHDEKKIKSSLNAIGDELVWSKYVKEKTFLSNTKAKTHAWLKAKDVKNTTFFLVNSNITN